MILHIYKIIIAWTRGCRLFSTYTHAQMLPNSLIEFHVLTAYLLQIFYVRYITWVWSLVWTHKWFVFIKSLQTNMILTRIYSYFYIWIMIFCSIVVNHKLNHVLQLIYLIYLYYLSFNLYPFRILPL